MIRCYYLASLLALILFAAPLYADNERFGENQKPFLKEEAVASQNNASISNNSDIPIILSGNCSDYIDLSSYPLPISESGTTVGATNNYGPFSSTPPCWENSWYAGSSAGPDRTYKWTAPSTGRYTISLCGSSYDTGLLLYNFTCPREPSYPGDFICGNDDACGTQSELYCREFSAGQQILIVVDGYSGSAGTFQLRISRYQPIQDLRSFISSKMASEHIPGLSACAISNGEIVWSGNFGHANISQNVDVTDSTLFMLCSISKTFLGVALMQLWEDGLFQLEDDINRYLPWEVHNPIYPSRAITFRMLMTHTSSIIDNWNVLNPLVTWGGDSHIPLDQFLMNYLTPGGSYYNPTANFGNYAPGASWNYCNVGAALAGFLVERLNPDSLSLEDYCQQYIFGPLEMNNSSWFLANLNTANVATPYNWNGSTYVPYQQSGAPFYPAGWVRTSTNQLARHLIAFMQHGQIEGTRILDSTTVELMFTPQVPGWGLFCLSITLGGRTIWGHSGSWYGARTWMFYSPEENTGAIVLTNGESTWGPQIILNELFEYAGHYNTIPEAPTLIEPADDLVSSSPYINFDWNEPISATLYNIQINSDSLFTSPAILDTTITNSNYANSDSLALGRYFWRVSAYNANGWSDYSPVWSFSIEQPGPVYVVGDANGSGSFNGLDVTYSVNYFRGAGNPPPYSYECTAGNSWFVASDVNNSCSFNGLDVTYMVNYFKGGAGPIPCVDCPPAGFVPPAATVQPIRAPALKSNIGIKSTLKN